MYYPDPDNGIAIYVQRESGPSNFRNNADFPASVLALSELRDDSNDFPLVSVVISKCFY